MQWIKADGRPTGIANQGEGRGERGYSARAATVDLWWEADVGPLFSLPLLPINPCPRSISRIPSPSPSRRLRSICGVEREGWVPRRGMEAWNGMVDED